MSYQTLLKILTNDKPAMTCQHAILNAPVRHSFMMATVWYLTQQSKREDFNIMEVGSWYGASALTWAQGLKTYNDAKGSITCVDAWEPFFDMDKHSDEIYKNMSESLNCEAAYNIFLHNVRTIPQTIRCQHLRGKSDNALPLLRDGHFDIAFVDGDHTYEAVKKDIENSLRLVKDGGVICGDDLNRQLFEVDKKHAEANHDKDLATDPTSGKKYHPGVTLAVAELFGKVSSWGGYWAMQKQGDTWQPIELKDATIQFPEHFPQHKIEEASLHLKDILRKEAV